MFEIIRLKLNVFTWFYSVYYFRHPYILRKKMVVVFI